AHIDAEHVGAGLEQPADHHLLGGGGTKRGEDLDLAVAPHRVPVPVTGGVPAPVTGGAPLTGSSVNCTIQSVCSRVSYSWKPARWKPRAKQSPAPAILNSRSATHMLTGPSQRPPRSASSA